MLDKIPNAEKMTASVEQSLYDIWNKLCSLIDEKYEMECLWNKGRKAWIYVYNTAEMEKRSMHYMQVKNCVGFMIILEKDERSKFDADRSLLFNRQYIICRA